MSDNLEKLKDLILYVADRSRDDPHFGATKLNKILYYADFRAYRELGHAITEADYQKLPEGPAARDLLKARRQLLDEGRIRIEHRPVLNFVQQRIVPVDPYRLRSLFSPDELAIVEDVLLSLQGMTGTQASEMSCLEAGWKLVDFYQTIPYVTGWFAPSGVEQNAEALAIARDALAESAPQRP
jgi:hypothetical protein